MDDLDLRLATGVSIEAAEAGVELRTAIGVWELDAPPGARAALLRLGGGPAPRAALDEVARSADGETSALEAYLQKLGDLGCLVWSVEGEAGPCVRLVRTGTSAPFRFEPLVATTRLVGSRFAYAHVLDGRTAIETPLAAARIECDGWLGPAVWALLARPRSCEEVCAELPSATHGTVRRVLELFMAAGVIDAEAASEPSGAAGWEFHDLLFHARTRPGRHEYEIGVAADGGVDRPRLPACKPTGTGRMIELARPDLVRLDAEDVPFSRVLEGRRSIRSHDETPLSVVEVGEFLFRVGRVMSQGSTESVGRAGVGQEVTRRPWPSGGWAHGLEIYANVAGCSGLERGLYHYDPLAHGLTQVSAESKHTRAMLAQAQVSGMRSPDRSVVFGITARFGRYTREYRGMAYALVLKDVGVLFSTMYLVATAMGLAPCALGGGPADALCKAAGLNYLEESPVGEFMLGRRVAEPASP